MAPLLLHLRVVIELVGLNVQLDTLRRKRGMAMRMIILIIKMIEIAVVIMMVKIIKIL